jgi:hypothetical protein
MRPAPNWRPQKSRGPPPDGWKLLIDDLKSWRPLPEHPIDNRNGVYRWFGTKREALLSSGVVGRLILTSQRLLVFSTGSHDVTAGRLLAGAVFLPLGLMTANTRNLNWDALENFGGLDLPLHEFINFENKGMFKYLLISFNWPDGCVYPSVFSCKNSGLPGYAKLIQAAINS